MMFQCNDCGEVFDEDELIVHTWKESHPYGDGYADEEMSECLCPFCKSQDLEKGMG